MSDLEFDFVVLGAGNAAGYVARAFVAKGIQPGQLALVGEEAFAPYERPALSKGFLLGQAKLPGFHTSVGVGGERQDSVWYESHGIQLLLGVTVTSVDVNAKVLTTDSGTVKARTALIIATGCSPIRLTRNPGHGLQGVCYLRNLADAEHIVHQLASVKTAVVVGGGYIGMEVSAAFASRGLDVTMVFPEAHLMQRLFTPEIAAFYEEFYRSKGVKIIKGVVCTEFVGENNVTGCGLNNGEVLPAELVVVGVGAVPNTQLFANQFSLERGELVVNEFLQTPAPDVYAIGDVAKFPLRKYNRLQRVEHVTCARLTAQYVVDHITSPETTPPFEYFPHFYSRVFNLSWRFWGDTVCDGVTVTVVGQLNPKLFAAWVAPDGRLIGAFLESGTEEENQIIKQAAQSQLLVSLEQLKAAQSVEAALQLL